MIDVAISYRPCEENNFQLEHLPLNIQLALFKYEIYTQNKEKILNQVEKIKDKVKVVHLPLDTLHIKHEKINDLINEVYYRTGCYLFVIHPNKGIENFLHKFGDSFPHISLCVETFAWRKKKIFRSPLEIVEAFNANLTTWMTIDTCHIEDIWFDHRIMSHLLKYTKVIHLSNRAKGLGSHIPFNHPNGELKLVPFVRDLTRRYNWNGVIVLEYMNKYSDKLFKNLKYVEKLLGY